MPHPSDPSFNRSNLLGWSVAGRIVHDYSVLVYGTNKVHRMWWQYVKAKITLEVASDYLGACMVHFVPGDLGGIWPIERHACCFLLCFIPPVWYTWTVHLLTAEYISVCVSVDSKPVRGWLFKKCLLHCAPNLKVHHNSAVRIKIKCGSVPAQSCPHLRVPVIWGAFVKTGAKDANWASSRLSACKARPHRTNPRQISYLGLPQICRHIPILMKSKTLGTKTSVCWWQSVAATGLLIRPDVSLRGTSWERRNRRWCNAAGVTEFKFPCLRYEIREMRSRCLRDIDCDRYYMWIK